MPVRPVFPGEGGGNGTGAVNSVNGEQGDVIITAQDLNAQPASTVLTDIASITMPDNSFLHTDGSGNFTPSLCMPAGLAWLSYTTVDQQKDHLALAEVASSGDYNDLINKPASVSVPTKTSDLTNDSGFITAGAIPSQVNSDWNSTSGKSQILNKPILFSGSYADLTGKPILFSGSYSDLTNKPTLFDGTYASLTGKPTTFTPAAHTHSISDVLGLQTSLDSKITVGASIPYSSLTGTPSIPAAQVNSDWTAVSGVSQVLNKPNLATVATSGSYADLTNKPVIPSVNYPVTSVNTKTGAVVLTNADVGAAASVHTHTISDVTGLQSSLDSKASTASLSGYVTTSSLNTSLSGYATTSALTSGLSSKFNAPTGTALQYVRGDGTLATTPIIPTVVSAFSNDAGYLTNAVLPVYRRVDNSIVTAPIKVKYYTVTSDSSSVWTVALGTDFTEVLDVQVQPVSVSNTIAGVRTASLNAYTTTATSISGITYGNNVLTTVLVGVGANTLALLPSTVVRVRVEGK
jgi:hypothetical protein